jgi:HSP20 family protein
VVEEDETDDAYEIRARLPGVPRERISVDVDEQELRISGELGEEERARALSRRGGRFLYRTTLPTGADPERAEADLADGVLRVRLPKSATPKRRRLRIGGTDRETEQQDRETEQQDRETEQLREQPREQPTERPREQPTEQSMGQATARAADRSMNRTGADT